MVVHAAKVKDFIESMIEEERHLFKSYADQINYVIETDQELVREFPDNRIVPNAVAYHLFKRIFWKFKKTEPLHYFYYHVRYRTESQLRDLTSLIDMAMNDVRRNYKNNNKFRKP